MAVVVDPQDALVRQALSYHLPRGCPPLRPGVRVRVPLQRRIVRGWVVGPAASVGGIPLKTVVEVEPSHLWLSAEQVAFGLWMARRFLSPPGHALAALSPPPGPRRGAGPRERRSRESLQHDPSEPASGLPAQGGGEGAPEAGHARVAQALAPLTAEQARAVEAIGRALTRGSPEVFLLWGVTGSGKTRVYEEAVERTLALQRSAVVLVPEIALAPQLVRRLRSRFANRVAVFHSQMASGERRRAWEAAASGTAVVLVGARSAALAPVERAGLYVIDEEHETSYKQDEAPRYHAREVVLKRAEEGRSVVVLGSATPSLEAYHAAAQGRFRLLSLPGRIDGRPLPEVVVVDLREELAATGRPGPISRPLYEALRETISRGEQAILFINRRGFAGALVCRECGFSWRCPHCDVSLTYHHGPSRVMRCHYCGYETSPLSTCPQCGGRELTPLGFGTQKIQAALTAAFPDVPVLRLDADTTGRRHAHERILDEFAGRSPAVLVGTQMVAKGHDFPGVTLAAAVLADVSLALPDFRAAERTFQQITQLAGRAGRGPRPGRVVVQTFRPDHHSVQAAASANAAGFYARELEFRRRSGYPPFATLVRLVAADPDEERARRAASELCRLLQEQAGRRAVRVLGPAPAPIRLLRDRFRWQVVVRGPDATVRDLVGDLLGQEPLRGRWKPESLTVDVDPVNVL